MDKTVYNGIWIWMAIAEIFLDSIDNVHDINQRYVYFESYIPLINVKTKNDMR